MEFEYEYEGRDGVPVTIKPNERYVLLAKTNDHWWQVRDDRSSKSFYIPAKYVKELPADFPSPLDFANPPNPELVVLPVVAPVPVPVPVPVPKPLEEPSGTRTKPGDEVTIRLRPDAAIRHHKNENRMSTFGVPLDFHDLIPPVVPTQRHPSNIPPSDIGTKASSKTTNMADGKKQPHLPGYLEDQKDSGKPRVPSFSPADPMSTPKAQNHPIPVETPVVPPHSNLHNKSTLSTALPDKHEAPPNREKEEEVVAEEEEEISTESGEEEEPLKEEDSNHIYESIQDLNLDVEALVREKVIPAAPPEPEPSPAPPPIQVKHQSVCLCVKVSH